MKRLEHKTGSLSNVFGGGFALSVYITKDKQDAYCKELTQRETRVLLSLGILCFSNVIMVQRIFRTTALRVSTACEPLCKTIRILETEIITLIKVKF